MQQNTIQRPGDVDLLKFSTDVWTVSTLCFSVIDEMLVEVFAVVAQA